MVKYSLYEVKNEFYHPEQIVPSCTEYGQVEWIKDFDSFGEALLELGESSVVPQSGTRGKYFVVTERFAQEEEWDKDEDGEEYLVQATNRIWSGMSEDINEL